MTPEQIVADLDASLVTDGRVITLQRLTLAAGGVQIPFSVDAPAFVRGYDPKDLVGGVTQQDRKVILSPTPIVEAGWTSGRPAHEDRRIPMKGNRVLIGGRPHSVEAAEGIAVADALVRIEMRVRG